MNAFEIKRMIGGYLGKGLKVFSTSSFQTQSVVLLKILSELDEKIHIYFLNTGYHFPETIAYKEDLSKLLNINVVDLKSNISKSEQKDSMKRLLFSSNPDRCCYLNKIMPMEHLLQIYDVWISGVRKSQTAARSTLNYEEFGPFNTVRFHPILDWTDSMVESFIQENELPRHPLEKLGYKSIGCEPCTRKLVSSKEINIRDGRWFGLSKTECGLHTELRVRVKL